MKKDTLHQLSPTSVLLHWVIGLLVIGLLISGIYIANFAPPGPDKLALLNIHKSIGVIVLPIAAARILWRFYNGMPKPLLPPPAWQKITAHIVHGVLLIATLSMPISGVMMTKAAGFPVTVFGLEILSASAKNPDLGKLAHAIHYYGSRIVIALVVIHLLAGVKHYYIDKNKIVQRMLGSKIAS